MKFVRTTSEIATREITQEVNNYLQTGSVLLLVSGGSNIQLAVNVRNKLNITNPLTIGLIDERFGPIGHQDSNWEQLLQAGLNLDGISALPVMTADTKSHFEAAEDYQLRLSQAIAKHDTVIGIFGIGIDGHTSGILPGSPATEATSIICAFTGPDFPRITTTPQVMPLIDQAFLVSYGDSKHEQLARLNLPLDISEQPAQVLKQIKELIVYSDFEYGSG